MMQVNYKRTIVLVHLLVVCILPMAQMVPLWCTHGDLQVFVFVWMSQSFQCCELIQVEWLRALELSLDRN